MEVHDVRARLPSAASCTALLLAALLSTIEPSCSALAESRGDDSRDATALLESLTFGDFDRREAVLRETSRRGLEAAAELVKIAEDSDSPLRLRARYVLRRNFHDLAPRLLRSRESAAPAVREKLEAVLFAMADLEPMHPYLDHHHGGWQKRGLVFEKLRCYDLALAAYQKWDPPQNTGCGTCNAMIKAEKPEAIVRCLMGLKQYEKAEEICWEQMGPEVNEMRAFRPEFPLSLVDIYEAKGQLEQFEVKLGAIAADPRSEQMKTAREYLAMRRDLLAGHYERLFPHLEGVYDLKYDLSRPEKWRHRRVAEAFGGMGEKAAPILAPRLSKHGGPNTWAIYALRLTRSDSIIEPLVNITLLPERYQGHLSDYGVPQVTLETLAEHRDKATEAIVRVLKSALHDDERGREAYKAAHLLGCLGTEKAIEPLIDAMDQLKNTCTYSLWQLTGETLGLEKAGYRDFPADAKSRWRSWWKEHKADFRTRPIEWWKSPEAASSLIPFLDLGETPFAWAAREGLLACEHPVLRARMIPPVPCDSDKTRPAAWVQYTIAKTWYRFDPEVCVPVFIEHVVSDHDTMLRVMSLTRKDFGKDAAKYRAWWAANKHQVKLEPEERWW